MIARFTLTVGKENTTLHQQVVLLIRIFLSGLFQAHLVRAARKLRIVVLDVVIFPTANRADFEFAVRG